MRQVNPYIAFPAAVGGGVLFGDNFDDSSFDTGKWSRRNNDPNVVVSETLVPGYVALESTVTTAVDDAIESIANFDYTGRTWQCELDVNTTLAGYFWLLGLEDNSGASNPARASWFFYNSGGGTTLNTQIRTGGVSTNGSDYLWASGVMKHIRIVHHAGLDTLDFDRSPDGVTWTNDRTQASASSLFDFTHARAFIWITGGGGATQPRSAIFRNLSVN